MNSERLIEIRDLAEDLSQGYWRDGRADPQAALGSGARVHLRDFGDAFDGLLEWRGDRFHAYCNTRHGEERLRFTLAHEAGHLFIDAHRNPLIAGESLCHPSLADFRSDSAIEREADLFAAHFLLPTDAFTRRAQRVPRGLAGIRQLAGEFKTSLLATALRYLDEILQEGVVLFWGTDGRCWSRVSREWWFNGQRHVLRDASRLVRGSATARLLGGEVPPVEVPILTAGSVASVWFPYISGHSQENRIFHEEAMIAGSYGFVTLLYPD